MSRPAFPLLSTLKQAGSADASLKLPIRTQDQELVGTLTLIGDWILGDPDTIRRISQWRQRAMRMFMAQFESTPEKTRGYLENLSLLRADRALFAIEDAGGRIVGHVGVADWDDNSAELDNLVRGEPGGHPKLAYLAELTILGWIFSASAIPIVRARILSYNWLVKDLHESIGFEVTDKLALRRSVEGSDVNHIVVPRSQSNVNYECLVLTLRRSEFQGRFPWLLPNRPEDHQIRE